MEDRIAQLVETDRLLIACDFDGTIAPIAPRPELAQPAPAVLNSLRLATQLPRTWVAVVSGRAMADLRAKLGDALGFWLVGGHGASISGPGLERKPKDAFAQLEVIPRLLLRAAPPSRGFIHERKPASIAVHHRAVARQEVEQVIPMLVYAIALPAGLQVKYGKEVVEFMAIDVDKGEAIAAIKNAVNATRVLYVGDDCTDEDAFRALESDDVTVKIGNHPTHAEFAVGTIEDAQRMICDLVSRRAGNLKSLS